MEEKKQQTDHHFHKHFSNGNHAHRKKKRSKYVVVKWWQFSQQFFLLFHFTRYHVIQFSDAIQKRKKSSFTVFEREQVTFFFLFKNSLFSFTPLQTEKCQKTFSILTKFTKKKILNLSRFQHYFHSLFLFTFVCFLFSILILALGRKKRIWIQKRKNRWWTKRNLFWKGKLNEKKERMRINIKVHIHRKR